MKILKGLNLDEFSVRDIETLYLDSKAVIEINDFLLASFKIHRGVRQGCPLSALLFIVFIEPFFKQLNLQKQLKVSGYCAPN